MLTWPKEQLGKPLDLISVQYILSCRKAQEFLHQFEFLHPTKEATETTTTAFTGSCNSSCSSNNHHHIQVGQMSNGSSTNKSVPGPKSRDAT